MLMEAHEAYRAGNIDTALLKYAMLAELGYEVAQSNVAFILDHGKFVFLYPEQHVTSGLPFLYIVMFLQMWNKRVKAAYKPSGSLGQCLLLVCM